MKTIVTLLSLFLSLNALARQEKTNVSLNAADHDSLVWHDGYSEMKADPDFMRSIQQIKVLDPALGEVLEKRMRDVRIADSSSCMDAHYHAPMVHAQDKHILTCPTPHFDRSAALLEGLLLGAMTDEVSTDVRHHALDRLISDISKSSSQSTKADQMRAVIREVRVGLREDVEKDVIKDQRRGHSLF
jgi:hypothetical protein